jgi:hypothetical protein
LPDALDIASGGGVVAFGSNSFDTLHRLRAEGAAGTLPVYIVVSKSGFDPKNAHHQNLKVGKVQFQGTLKAIVDADRRGRHPVPERRPASAREGDSGSALFWEVEGLREIEPSLTVEDFSTASGKAWQTTPEGPVEAHLGHPSK